MKRLALAFSWVFVLFAAARADDATDLLYFSGDLMTERGYGGVGWLHAASGLDFSGPVLSAEIGRPELGFGYGQATFGWRFVQSGLYFTLLGGAEIDRQYALGVNPLVSADVWWEPAKGWMAAAQVQATPAYVSWRAAIGLRPVEGWPWFGPEAGSDAGEPRVGLHATGLRIVGGLEARISGGVAWWCGRAGPYVDLSLWRRF